MKLEKRNTKKTKLLEKLEIIQGMFYTMEERLEIFVTNLNKYFYLFPQHSTFLSALFYVTVSALFLPFFIS